MSYFKSKTIEPFSYQRSALASTLRGIFWEKIASQLIVLPTGTGKTIVFGFLAGYFAEVLKRRVLILAHRDNLIEQAQEKLGFLGIRSAVEKASRRAREMVALGSMVVVGSVQTMKGRRLESWPRDTFDLIVIDEAHHATSDSYKNIIKHFPEAWVVGVTATDRSDKKKLGKVFKRKSYEMTLPDAIAENWLVPIVGVRGDVQVDLRGITTRAGDFDIHQLDERISMVIEPLAIAVKKEVGSRKTMVFTPDVKTAFAFADALRQIGVNAKATSGADPHQKRTLAEFKDDVIQVLVNCALLTEGYDEPPVSAIVIARPTKSSTLLMQMIGRGTRRHPASGKTDCLVVDFGWVINDENVKTIVDLFAGSASDADVAHAKRLVASNEVSSPEEALARAKAAREAKEAATLKREQAKLKVKIQDREVKYKRITFDPVGVRRACNLREVTHHEGIVGMPVNPATASKLKDLGFDSTTGMSQNEAEGMVATLKERKACGMASLKQIAYLTRHGHATADFSVMTSQQAQDLIGSLMQRFAKQRSG